MNSIASFALQIVIALGLASAAGAAIVTSAAFLANNVVA